MLEARDLSVRHLRRGSLFARATYLQALDSVSFALAPGEALAIVGESGSGKSTLVRSLFRLHKPPGGQVLVDGVDLAILTPAELRERRRRMQMVFQDPLASLDPTMTVRAGGGRAAAGTARPRWTPLEPRDSRARSATAGRRGAG